jgi:hypothetical protein
LAHDADGSLRNQWQSQGADQGKLGGAGREFHGSSDRCLASELGQKLKILTRNALRDDEKRKILTKLCTYYAGVNLFRVAIRWLKKPSLA